MSKDSFKRKSQCEVGPGGMKCPCCAPKPGSRALKALTRRARSRFKAETRKIVAEATS
tara:strand:- start:287 stop:460 length:174 start_codon:yes stop_codon:yes gene_type:complete